MQTIRAGVKRNVRYSGNLTSIELLLDATGLATNTTNSYGQVDGSNNIVQWNSLAPGPTGRDFTVNGSGVTFDSATKSIAFNGSGTLRSTGAASLFNFLSFHASGHDSIKWTAFVVCKMGTSHKPAAAQYGLFGNNGGSSVNKGAATNYANTTTNEDTFVNTITRGTSGQFMGSLTVPGAAPSNKWCVVTVQMDGALSQPMRIFLNDQALIAARNQDNNSSPVTTPSFVLELGGRGNGSLPLIGNIKEIIITSTAVAFANTIAVIRQLMNKHNIVRSRSTDYLPTSYVTAVSEEDDGVGTLDYALSCIISQDPTDPKTVFSAYSRGSQHAYGSTKKLVGRLSTFKGAPLSFGAETDIYDPAGNDAVQDCGGGFDQNGVMHLFADVWNSGSNGSQVSARHIYSSDLTSWTNTDITSSLASDGLACYRMFGNLIHISGVWMKAYYKRTDQTTTTNSAIYILRSTNGTSWTSITVRASTTTPHLNEGSIFHLGGDNVGLLVRNETTGEWSFSLSTDLGQTWDAFTDVAFGETVVTANPPMVKTFTHNGQMVVVAYITNRDNDTAFAIYGLPANIVSSRGSGWDIDTKIMWWKTTDSPWHYQYGDVAHLDNTINAVGLYAYDNFPGSGSGLANFLHYIQMPTWHIAKIESELGI